MQGLSCVFAHGRISSKDMSTGDRLKEGASDPVSDPDIAAVESPLMASRARMVVLAK